MPMHGPHALSSMRAPLLTSFLMMPASMALVYTCLEPGDTPSDTPGATVLPSRMSAAIPRSLIDELVQDPMAACTIFLPSISRTGTTRSGMWGWAIIGSILERSISIISSYSAPSSAARLCQPSRFWSASHSLVTWSLGKMEVVTPSSAPMLVIVARWGTERLATPSPKYSNTLPTPFLTVHRRKSSSITSFALHIS